MHSSQLTYNLFWHEFWRFWAVLVLTWVLNILRCSYLWALWGVNVLISEHFEVFLFWPESWTLWGVHPSPPASTCSSPLGLSWRVDQVVSVPSAQRSVEMLCPVSGSTCSENQVKGRESVYYIYQRYKWHINDAKNTEYVHR